MSEIPRKRQLIFSSSSPAPLNTDSESFGGGGKGTAEKVKSEKIPMHGFENSISLDLAGLSVIYLTPPVKRKTNKNTSPKTKQVRK